MCKLSRKCDISHYICLQLTVQIQHCFEVTDGAEDLNGSKSSSNPRSHPRWWCGKWQTSQIPRVLAGQVSQEYNGVFSICRDKYSCNTTQEACMSCIPSTILNIDNNQQWYTLVAICTVVNSKAAIPKAFSTVALKPIVCTSRKHHNLQVLFWRQIR